MSKKKKLSAQLFGKTDPSSIKRAAIGAFIGFFVYAGALFTSELIFSYVLGTDRVFLYATEDGDMADAQRVARDLQNQIDRQKADAAAKRAYERHREKVERQDREWQKTKQQLPVFDKNGNCIKNCPLPNKKGT